MSRYLPLPILLFGLACATPAPKETAPDLTIVRAQIDSLWTTYSAAAVSGDADALAKLYADDAYVVETGLATVRGNAEVHSVVKGIFGGVHFLESSIKPELTEMAGDRVLQFGVYRDVLQATGKPVEIVNGRYAAVLLRDGTSSWKLSRLLAVADSSVPQPAKPQ